MTEITAVAHYKNKLVFLKDVQIKESKDYTCKRAWFVAKNENLEKDPEKVGDLSYAYVNVVKKNVTYDSTVMESL